MSLITYPTKAADIANSIYAGTEDAYYLFECEDSGDPRARVDIVVRPDSPIAINRVELRDEIFQATGVMLPTRAEIGKKSTLGVSGKVMNSWPKVNWDSLYTMATGPILMVEQIDPEGVDPTQAFILLYQNSFDKPVNPGRWNVPSRLVSSLSPFETMHACMQTEIGLFAVAGRNLLRLSPQLPKGFPRLAEDFESRVQLDMLKQPVREELARRCPEIARAFQLDKTDIFHVAVETRKADVSALTRKVRASILGRAFSLEAHFLRDDDKSSLNVHVPLILEVGFNLAAIDPDRHRKNAALVKMAEAAKLDLIPAPADFVNGMLTFK